MKVSMALLVVVFVVAAASLAGGAFARAPYSYDSHSASNPLFDYVNKPDPHFSWFDTGHRIANTVGYDGIVLNMTSQGWLTANDSNRPIWTHQLVMIVPHKLRYTDTAALYITGGDNGNPNHVPKNTDEEILAVSFLACEAGTIGAVLYQVPNQPVVFADDPSHRGRGEDAFMAWTWYEFMRNLDRPEWISLLPMTKSAVKAMDAMTEYAAKSVAGANLSKFMVAGASKRGWTTWLTGAVDPRVIGIAPIVMDMLNFAKNLPHMYKAYGGWTFAFKDYWALNLTSSFGTDPFNQLATILDPLTYKSTMTMPKLVVDSVGDEFFMPDDDAIWWGMLEGETYRLMAQNAEHSFATGVLELLASMNPFYQSLLLDATRPKLDWTISTDPMSRKISATTNTKPKEVLLWTATTFDTKRRDFRLVKGNTPTDPCEFIPVHVFGDACINPVLWNGMTVTNSSYNATTGEYGYVAAEPLPEDGYWRGFFLEFIYPGPKNTDSNYRFTTQVSIIPDTFPFPDCRSLPGDGCKATLV